MLREGQQDATIRAAARISDAARGRARDGRGRVKCRRIGTRSEGEVLFAFITRVLREIRVEFYLAEWNLVEIVFVEPALSTCERARVGEYPAAAGAVGLSLAGLAYLIVIHKLSGVFASTVRYALRLHPGSALLPVDVVRGLVPAAHVVE